ncbi:hypothetical protein [Oerskovia flava]|uniref:DUF7832 domain-containing protein n=1 Tax=Oerskovia flava TaxID=2986422 RepID=UPI00223FA4E5|nr:hypothetical protein [Oerskovia sp. JB1-3-2]
MTYDDVAWHTEDDFPADLPPEAAATHIGLFLAWAVLSGHASDRLLDELADDVAALRERATTGARLVLALDGALTDDALTDVGNAFAAAYYAGGDGDTDGDPESDDDAGGLYLEDYVDALSPEDGVATDVYRVPDTWDSYDQVAPLIDARFAQWDEAGRPAVLRHGA